MALVLLLSLRRLLSAPSCLSVCLLIVVVSVVFVQCQSPGEQ